jgi:hypothetical protein
MCAWSSASWADICQFRVRWIEGINVLIYSESADDWYLLEDGIEYGLSNGVKEVKSNVWTSRSADRLIRSLERRTKTDHIRSTVQRSTAESIIKISPEH